MNLLISRLDEQQRRWYIAVEANRIGHGGIRLLSQITGMDEKTIQRGQQELEQSLADRTSEQIRLPGRDVNGQKKRDKDRSEIARDSRSRNSRKPDEQSKVGTQQSTAPEREDERKRTPSQSNDSTTYTKKDGIFIEGKCEAIGWKTTS